MRRVKSELLSVRPPATTTCPHCGGLLGRYRAPDLDRVLDWLVWTCLACARLFCVTSAGRLTPWVEAPVLAK